VTVETRASAPSSGKPRVALYSFNIVNLFRASATGMVGGAEVQYHLLAHHLAAEFDVHVVTLAPAPPDDLVVPPGFTLHLVSPAHDDPSRNRVAVFVGRSRSFWRAFKAADAQVYLERGAGFATFLTWLYARLHRRRFVYHWASDADLKGLFMKEFPGIRPFYRLARRHADAQVCQTEAQLAMLSPRERRRATIIPNSLDTRIAWRPADGPEVLWVGTIKGETKRPDLFLDLAAALPHRRFRMVGEVRGGAGFQEAFKARAATLPNVTVTGFVPRAQLPGQYRHGRVLVNVSDHEGFPNTFLEACACGVPVVSLNVDPNGILARQGVGTFLAGDKAGLAPAVERLFQDGPWQEARKACAEVARQHQPATAARRVADLIHRLLGERRANLPQAQNPQN
jgi:glycosyltransferase involved in cell wall biosynthesis